MEKDIHVILSRIVDRRKHDDLWWNTVTYNNTARQGYEYLTASWYEQENYILFSWKCEVLKKDYAQADIVTVFEVKQRCFDKEPQIVLFNVAPWLSIKQGETFIEFMIVLLQDFREIMDALRFNAAMLEIEKGD